MEFGTFQLDTRLHELRREGVRIPIEPKPFDLLRMLIENRDKIVEKDEIIDRLWNGRIVSESTLSSSLNAVRRAVGDDGKRQEVIRTVPRRGFRFVPPVAVYDEARADAVTEREKSGDVGLVTLEERSTAFASFRPSIAVMPFENLSADPEQNFFADGLTEDIITALSLWRSFPVISRNSTFAYRGRSPDIRQVGEELGARYVIEGSVRRSGNKVRVTAQFIDTETGHHVWAERYDRPLDDFFDLQDEIADRIAAIIEPALNKAEGKRIAAKRPSELAAWEHCIKGFAQLETLTTDANRRARAMFEAALELDPDYARAYSGIANAYCRDFRVGYPNSDVATARAAIEAARHAVALDETDSQTHMMLARAHSCLGDGEAAIAEGRRALQLNPHDTDALVMTGSFLGFWGETEEGIRLLENGLELNPLDPRSFNFMGHLCAAYVIAGDYDAALRWGRESTRRNPDFMESHVNLAACLGYLGRGEEAQALLKRFEYSPVKFVQGRTWYDQGPTEILIRGLRKAGFS